MKSFLSILAIVFCSFVFGQNIKWLKVEEAAAAVKANPKKPILLSIYTDWCGFCKKMENETFVDAGVINYVNENYIPVRFNAETNSMVNFLGINYSYIKAARANYLAYVLTGGKLSYPSTLVLDNQGISERLIFGYRSPAEFSKDIKI